MFPFFPRLLGLLIGIGSLAWSGAGVRQRTVMLPGGVPLALVFVPAPGAPFGMGAEESDPERQANEGPRHDVLLRDGFWMGRFEVSQAQWRAVMGTGVEPYFPDPQGRLPMESVSWNDAQAFLAALNALGADGVFRLPSEAEWEWAARGGSASPRYGAPDDIAWHSGNAGSRTHPGGEKKPNAFGLYDMLGGVWEWCADSWHRDFRGAPADGAAWTEDGATVRVLKGGAFHGPAGFVRAAARGGVAAGHRDLLNGFRVAFSGR